MDWDKIKDGGGWVTERVNEAIWGWIYNLASSFASEAFDLLTKYIILETDIERYLNVDQYLSGMRWIAFGLLSVAVAWEGLKQAGGPSAYRTQEMTVAELTTKTAWAGVCIYFLPWSLTHLFLNINNTLVRWISSIGIEVRPGANTPLDILFMPQKLSEIIVVMLLVLGIAAFILGIVAGIRYVEITILLLIAPIVAVSIVRTGDALDVWIRETTAVVFTQALQLFLLQFLLQVIGKFDGVESFVIAIGLVVVMIKGPAALRKFCYSAGVGSASVRTVGSAGRMAAMKYIASAVK